MVIDLFSRQMVDWSLRGDVTPNIVIDALRMAWFKHHPGKHAGVLFHSDRGSPYARIAFGNRCREKGVRASMGTVGDAYDNAMAESFFATLECEHIARRSWRTKTEA